jgi:thiol-disulfide isomerase/thioredoxin
MRNWIAAALLFAALPAGAAELQPLGRGSWQELLAAHAGRPSIVHFWGLTCAPCLAELPRWGELLRERKNLDLVLIAADPMSQEEERIAGTLKRAGLGAVESWGFAGFASRLRFEIDPRWHGELPRTLLVAADGTSKALTGVADLDEVRAWLDAQPAAHAEAR